jgi:hemerythrin-like domain-containing protein
VLEDLIDHHVDEEEDTGFGCARDDFKTEELEAMRDEFQRRRQRQMLSARD